MKGFHISASGAIQGHHGPIVQDYIVVEIAVFRYTCLTLKSYWPQKEICADIKTVNHIRYACYSIVKGAARGDRHERNIVAALTPYCLADDKSRDCSNLVTFADDILTHVLPY